MIQYDKKKYIQRKNNNQRKKQKKKSECIMNIGLENHKTHTHILYIITNEGFVTNKI